MKGTRKTKAELTAELEALVRRVAKLEAEREQTVRRLPAVSDGERLFRALAENTSAHISVVEGDRYIYANQAFLDYYGVDMDDLRCTTPEDLMQGLISPQMVQEVAPIAQAAIERGETQFHFELQYLDGMWLQTNVTILDLDGRRIFVMMGFDITELKRAQNEMYRADKMAALGQIVAGVAHEINNPNNFITFNLPILRRYVEAIAPLLERCRAEEPDLRILGMELDAFVPDLYKLIDNMELGSQRITGIVSDLRGYVRNDEDQERRAAPIRPAVERVMTLVGRQVRKMVRKLEVELADELPDVVMNPSRIEQVLINLLINAAEAADKEDSLVRVTARRSAEPGGWVELAVEDNGAGIPADRLERIFEPFYTSKGRDKGTGLGLSIAQRIVEEHGGRIGVHSTLGRGTCFTVLLPPAP